MPLVFIVPAFVTAAMYLRRHFGGGALAALWAITSTVMAVTNSALFLELVNRVGGTSASSAGRSLTMAFMLLLMAMSFGASALTIHRRDADEGPWFTARGFVLGVVGFVAGGAIAYSLVALTIVLVVSQMAP